MLGISPLVNFRQSVAGETTRNRSTLRPSSRAHPLLSSGVDPRKHALKNRPREAPESNSAFSHGRARLIFRKAKRSLVLRGYALIGGRPCQRSRDVCMLGKPSSTRARAPRIVRRRRARRVSGSLLVEADQCPLHPSLASDAIPTATKMPRRSERSSNAA